MKDFFSFLTDHLRRTMLLAIIWCFLIFFACFLPGSDFPRVEIVNLDKFVHVILFGICAFLWGIGLSGEKKNRDKTLFWVFLACVGLGVLVELIQETKWVIGRSGDVYDALSDAIGAFLGVTFARWIMD